MDAMLQPGALTARTHPRGRHLLLIFLAASAALHAAVLTLVAWLPPPASEGAIAKANALEVVILPPEPPPLTPPATVVPPLPSPRKNVPPRAAPVATAQTPFTAQRPTELALPHAAPDPGPAAEPVARASPAQQDEARAVTPEPKQAAAETALVPPSANATYLRNPAPRYPLIARRNGEQGVVTLRVLVTREGMPAQVRVEKSSGSSHLDGAALEAVKAWRFAPARRGAEAVEAWVLVPVVFRLEGVS